MGVGVGTHACGVESGLVAAFTDDSAVGVAATVSVYEMYVHGRHSPASRYFEVLTYWCHGRCCQRLCSVSAEGYPNKLPGILTTTSGRDNGVIGHVCEGFEGKSRVRFGNLFMRVCILSTMMSSDEGQKEGHDQGLCDASYICFFQAPLTRNDACRLPHMPNAGYASPLSICAGQQTVALTLPSRFAVAPSQ